MPDDASYRQHEGGSRGNNTSAAKGKIARTTSRELVRTYSLRRFRSSRDPDYYAALGIYLSTITPDIRTNSNQITYWLDRTYAEFGDEFCICGFFENGKVIGFAEFAYFRAAAVLALDYLSLHSQHQSQSEYLQFTRMVREWIDLQPFEFDFAVTEIPFETTVAPGERSLLEADLYRQMGFGLVHCEYSQAPLGLENPQSDLPAHLMVMGRQPLSAIRAETAIHLVRTVYYEHHLRWYLPFLEDVSAYESKLDARMASLERSLGGKQDVPVNGMKMLNPAIPAATAPAQSTPAVIVASLSVLLALLVFVATLVTIGGYIHATWQVLAVSIGGSLLAFVAIFSLFHEPSGATLDSLLRALKGAFGRRK